MNIFALIIMISTMSGSAWAGEAPTQVADTLVASPKVELLRQGRDYSDMSEYDFAVDGEAFTVTIGASDRSGQVTLYDAEGEVIVGYRYAKGRLVIHDHQGLVQYGAIADLNLDAVRTYGAAARLLTDPHFLSSFLTAHADDQTIVDSPEWPWAAVFDSPLARFFMV